MTEAIEKRLAELRNKLRARAGSPAYAKNAVALKDEIARLEAMLEQAKQAPAEKAPRAKKPKK